MKTDGKFIIESGGITQGIQKELGLSNEECKQLQKNSVWEKIINEVDDNTTIENNNNEKPNKENGYKVYKNAVISFTKDAWERIVTLVNKALNKNIEIEGLQDNSCLINSQIINDYYTSEHTYTKKISDNLIIITDVSKKETTQIDLEAMLEPLKKNKYEHIDELKNIIYDLPAEVLLDLNAEVTFDEKFVFSFMESAAHIGSTDTIKLSRAGVTKMLLIHELGHAIDAKQKGNTEKEVYRTASNLDFISAFTNDMTRYLNDGHKRLNMKELNEDSLNDMFFDKNNIASKGNSTYATIDEQEMFAECYCLLMLGTCDSEQLISAYFQDTLKSAKKIIMETRELPAQQRHLV